MKPGGLIILLVLMGLPCMAQQQSCPLQPTLVKNNAAEISISLQNTTGKQITSYHFGLTFQDVNGGTHVLPQEFVDRFTLKPFARRTAIWHSPQALQFSFPFAKAYLLDATFRDGTQWIDDGSHSCSMTSAQE